MNAALLFRWLRRGVAVAGLFLVGCNDGFGQPRLKEPQSAPEDKQLMVGLPALHRQTLDLGVVSQRGQKQETVWLTNGTNEPVEVAGVQTSCPCLKVDIKQRLIGALEKVSARVLLDLAGEPDFVGNLGIDVNGVKDTGKIAFAFVVNVQVHRQQDNGK
jgi:hypothetical protein